MANTKLSVLDVAAFILSRQGKMTAMKLQKLVYYGQAWSLVWDERPLFKEKIEAWANGPVVPKLFDQHRGKFEVSRISGGHADRLNKRQQETVLAVLRYYGGKSSQWLSDLTHMERPWKEARRGIPENQRGDKEITQGALHEYYSGLCPTS